MNARNLILGVALLVSSANSTARGSVMLAVEKGSAVPGGTALVGVFATSDSNDQINGFNLPIDINSDGDTGFPTGLSLAADPILDATELYMFTEFDHVAAIFDVDGVATGSGSDVTLGLVPTKLFDLVLEVDPLMETGRTIPITIVNPTPFFNLFSLSGPGTDPAVSALSGGSITVTPEPSSLLALCSLGVVVGLVGVLRSRSNRYPRPEYVFSPLATSHGRPIPPPGGGPIKEMDCTGCIGRYDERCCCGDMRRREE